MSLNLVKKFRLVQNSHKLLPKNLGFGKENLQSAVLIWGEKLRSSACSRQTKRNFFIQFHTTWCLSFRACFPPSKSGTAMTPAALSPSAMGTRTHKRWTGSGSGVELVAERRRSVLNRYRFREREKR